MKKNVMIPLVLVVGWPGILAAGSPCRVGTDGKSDCPADVSHPGGSWVYDASDGSYIGEVCDASPDSCQNGDPDTDSQDNDPCNTCTLEPIGSPSDTGSGCVWPAVLVCPDPQCDAHGQETWVLEFSCSQRLGSR